MPVKSLMLLLTLSTLLAACFNSENETAAQHNVIKDKIYGDQFNAMNKAQNVESVLMDAEQTRREMLEQQSNP